MVQRSEPALAADDVDPFLECQQPQVVQGLNVHGTVVEHLFGDGVALERPRVLDVVQ